MEKKTNDLLSPIEITVVSEEYVESTDHTCPFCLSKGEMYMVENDTSFAIGSALKEICECGNCLSVLGVVSSAYAGPKLEAELTEKGPLTISFFAEEVIDLYLEDTGF